MRLLIIFLAVQLQLTSVNLVQVAMDKLSEVRSEDEILENKLIKFRKKATNQKPDVELLAALLKGDDPLIQGVPKDTVRFTMSSAEIDYKIPASLKGKCFKREEFTGLVFPTFDLYEKKYVELKLIGRSLNDIIYFFEFDDNNKISEIYRSSFIY